MSVKDAWTRHRQRFHANTLRSGHRVFEKIQVCSIIELLIRTLTELYASHSVFFIIPCFISEISNSSSIIPHLERDCSQFTLPLWQRSRA